MAAIHNPRVEVRKNTFTNWCNEHLKGSGTKISDLRTELYDAPKLISLLKQLSGKEVGGWVGLDRLSFSQDVLVCKCLVQELEFLGLLDCTSLHLSAEE